MIYVTYFNISPWKRKAWKFLVFSVLLLAYIYLLWPRDLALWWRYSHTLNVRFITIFTFVEWHLLGSQLADNKSRRNPPFWRFVHMTYTKKIFLAKVLVCMYHCYKNCTVIIFVDIEDTIVSFMGGGITCWCLKL